MNTYDGGADATGTDAATTDPDSGAVLEPDETPGGLDGA
ncbi:MAG: hypothetical protein JWM01_1497, partial [Arthrobacter sp.]|nr:hypothetical protein [Arthrobacter sp.]